MTVSELMSLLEDLDPDATVRIMMQENWPFECAVDGVVTRDMLGNPDCDCDRRIGEPWRIQDRMGRFRAPLAGRGSSCSSATRQRPGHCQTPEIPPRDLDGQFEPRRSTS